jgi:hypothetical protein
LNDLVKFYGAELRGSVAVEFVHPNLWQREEHPSWSRLTIGAQEDEIPLILEFCRQIEGPFAVLYVLVEAGVSPQDGRYQSPGPLSYKALELFLYRFWEFFEQDGRHLLWVMSVSGQEKFILDNHNVIYAYGDLDQYEAQLRESGFVSGKVQTPNPHGHNFHPEFDDDEAELMAYWDWIWFPLQEVDHDN